MIDTFDLALPHGITLNCRATGRPGAPLLVFLHGFPEAAFVWDEVLEHFGSRLPVRRFWVSAQDAVSVQRGLAALKDNAQYVGFGAAAQQRGRADWLIGMNLSRAYTLRARRGGSQTSILPPALPSSW